MEVQARQRQVGQGPARHGTYIFLPPLLIFYFFFVLNSRLDLQGVLFWLVKCASPNFLFSSFPSLFSYNNKLNK